MDQLPPLRRETAEQRLERISKMPGVVVHRNPESHSMETPRPTFRSTRASTVDETSWDGMTMNDDIDW